MYKLNTLKISLTTVVTFLIFCSFNQFATAQTTPPQEPTPISENVAVLGAYKWVGILENDQMLPPSDLDLDLLIQFSQDNVSRLFWSKKNAPGFCDRKADYQVKGHVLYQKVTWTHPENQVSCVNSPDMQVGYESISSVSRMDKYLLIGFSENGKPRIYIFEAFNKSGLLQ